MFALCSLLSERRRQSLASISVPQPITNVEEFVPDEGVLDRSFLEDMNFQERGTPQHLETESDRYLFATWEEVGNVPHNAVYIFLSNCRKLK
jgi:hypothetical protein